MTKWHELYELLDNLIQLHKALYTLAVQKKDVLIKGDVDELVAITKQEQKLIQAVGSAEEARQAVAAHLFASLGFTRDNGTLSDLIKLTTSAEEKMRLTTYRDELMRIVSELRDANELNQQLLEQSLSFVNMTLNLITDAPEDDFIYGNPTAEAFRGSHRSFFNTKA